MHKDIYCWICHRNRVRLPCKYCFRNYHLACAQVKNAKYSFVIDEASGYHEFADRCPECIKLKEAADKWDSGLEFKRIPKNTLNTLLLRVWESLKKDAPRPFLWSADKFSKCPIPMDVNRIKLKAIDNLYTNPREFLADITLINHNCASISKNDSDGNNLAAEMKRYKSYMMHFKRLVETKISYVEDCPYCILNSHKSDEWLTMACPWGHQIILVESGGSRYPAKLIRFNRSSGRIDIILFGTGERKRVNEDECWIPCLSDLHCSNNPDSEMAYRQAKVYISTLQEKFGRKFSLPKETRTLNATDNNYVYKENSHHEDIVLWSDDEPSAPVERFIKDRVKNGVKSYVRDDAKKVTSSAEMRAVPGIENEKDLREFSPKKIKIDSSADIQILKERLIRAEDGKEHQQELINGYQSQIKLLEKIDEENQKRLKTLKETCSIRENEIEKLKMQLSDEQHKTEMLGKNEEIVGERESKLKRLTDNFDHLRSSIIAFLEIANLDDDVENIVNLINHSNPNCLKRSRKK